MLVKILQGLDKFLMQNRDMSRYEDKDLRKCHLETMFGSVAQNLNKGIIWIKKQNALRDYREILREQRLVDTTGMRPMGAAESNIYKFAKKTKKQSYSWSCSVLNKRHAALYDQKI